MLFYLPAQCKRYSMVLFPIFEMLMVRSDCDPTFPFRRLNFLYLDFMGKLKVPKPPFGFSFYFDSVNKNKIEQLCPTSYIHQENAPVSLI